ncbi:MAG: helix-turn-helix domain-containing protein [Gordonia sp. (in: high G+C Gram-positive bacteria)]|uniref:TetR/AcrR family transcriptional regulator n=1 Tax=Gordonia sp. (in: high G+C Gram-positive bacteria) TaxID=84139 RepID=UPI0039E27C00
MATIEQTAADPADFRVHVVAESIRLFSENGYDATTVDDVAAAAGTSRRTLFRHFGSKEDLIFADHESLLDQVSQRLDSAGDEDPWWAVCEGAELVFAHFAANSDLAARRYAVVSQTPALADRERVTASRYQRLFERFLQQRLPGVPRVQTVSFAAAVTGAHNHLLRRMSRGDAAATAAALNEELSRLRCALAG